MPRPPSENPSEKALLRRKQREAKANGIAKPKGRAKQCDLAKEALKSDKPVEALKKLLKNKKISVAGLKRCFKEDRITDKALVLLDIKHRKKKETKSAVKKEPVKEPVKKSQKKDKDEKPRGSKGGSGGGSGESQSKVQTPVPAEKLVQQIAPSQEPLTALQFLNRRRFERGEKPIIKDISSDELERAKVLVAKAQEEEFGQSNPKGDPHAKPPGFKPQNPHNAHDNIAGITQSKASEQEETNKGWDGFNRVSREAKKQEAQSNLDSLLSNVEKAVASGFEKAELRLDAPVLGNFVLQGEPTQQFTLQQQSGFNQGDAFQQRTIAQTQLEQDEARMSRNYQQFDHSVLSQYAVNPTDVNVELASNQDELEPEDFEEESESDDDDDDDDEEPSPISGRMMGLFV